MPQEIGQRITAATAATAGAAAALTAGAAAALAAPFAGPKHGVMTETRREKIRRKLDQEIYLTGELTHMKHRLAVRPPRKGKRCHCYVSPYNIGGSELVDEANAFFLAKEVDRQRSRLGKEPRGEQDRSGASLVRSRSQLSRREVLLLKTTVLEGGAASGAASGGAGKTRRGLREDEEEEQIACEVMLVYLTGQTWTRGRASELLGRDVARAMARGVPVVLAHEMPGLGQEKRAGCPFSDFFLPNQTPEPLRKAGIYNVVAVPFKGGAWRHASRAMLLLKLAAYHPPTKPTRAVIAELEGYARAVEAEALADAPPPAMPAPAPLPAPARPLASAALSSAVFSSRLLGLKRQSTENVAAEMGVAMQEAETMEAEGFEREAAELRAEAMARLGSAYVEGYDERARGALEA